MRLNEIAVHAKNIPEKYRHLKFLGKGWTSRVFDYDEDHVLIFTRDQIKQEWLRDGLNAEYIDSFESGHPYKSIANFPIFVYKVEKMYPLSKLNKKKVNLIVNKFYRLSYTRDRTKTNDYGNFINNVMNMAQIEFADVPSYENFISFISNYDEKNFNFDLSNKKNFMQNKKGEIIFTDPIVDGELFNAIIKYKEVLRYNRFRSEYA